MTKFGFSNDVRAKLLEENFDTASFAMIALTLMELDTIIKAYEADLQREFTRKEVAAFRQLWQFCQQKAQPATPQPLAASASTAPPSIASGWSETFQPSWTPTCCVRCDWILRQHILLNCWIRIVCLGSFTCPDCASAQKRGVEVDSLDHAP